MARAVEALADDLQVASRLTADPGLMARLRAFVADTLARLGFKGTVGRHRIAVRDAVLRALDEAARDRRGETDMPRFSIAESADAGYGDRKARIERNWERLQRRADVPEPMETVLRTRRFSAMPPRTRMLAAFRHVMDHLRDEYTNESTGWTIRVSKSSAKELSGKRDDPWRLDALDVLPDLIRRAVLGDTHPDTKRRPEIKAVHHLYAPMRAPDAGLETGSTRSRPDPRFVVELTVFELQDGRKLYNHDLVEISDPAESPPGGRVSDSPESIAGSENDTPPEGDIRFSVGKPVERSTDRVEKGRLLPDGAHTPNSIWAGVISDLPKEPLSVKVPRTGRERVFGSVEAAHKEIAAELTKRQGEPEQSDRSEARYWYTPNGRSIRLATHAPVYFFWDSGINLSAERSPLAYNREFWSDLDGVTMRDKKETWNTANGPRDYFFVVEYTLDPAAIAEAAIEANAALTPVPASAIEERTRTHDEWWKKRRAWLERLDTHVGRSGDSVRERFPKWKDLLSHVLRLSIKPVYRTRSYLTEYLLKHEFERANPSPFLPPVHLDRHVEAERGRAAVRGMMTDHRDRPAVMERVGLGPVSFVWGREGNPANEFRDGHGVAHILARRGAEGHAAAAVLDAVVNAIALGREVRRYGPARGERVDVEHEGHTAVLSLHRFGERESWLLTGWRNEQEKGGSGEDRASASADPFAPQASGSRPAVGAEPDDSTPDGAPRFSIAPPTDSPAFKRWFGDSKVVDEDGKPTRPGDRAAGVGGLHRSGVLLGGTAIRLFSEPSRSTRCHPKLGAPAWANPNLRSRGHTSPRACRWKNGRRCCGASTGARNSSA